MPNLISKFTEDTINADDRNRTEERFPTADPPLADQNTSDGNPYHLLQRHPVFDQEAAYRERERAFSISCRTLRDFEGGL